MRQYCPLLAQIHPTRRRPLSTCGRHATMKVAQSEDAHPFLARLHFRIGTACIIPPCYQLLPISWPKGNIKKELQHHAIVALRFQFHDVFFLCIACKSELRSLRDRSKRSPLKAISTGRNQVTCAVLEIQIHVMLPCVTCG